MGEEYKETLEWRALSKIWKAIEPAKRQGLMEEFRLLTDWVKRDMELAKPEPEPPKDTGAGESGFLNGFSPKTKALVLRRLTSGQGNLYDECMEIAWDKADEDTLWGRFLAAHAGDAALMASEAEVREILRACAGK